MKGRLKFPPHFRRNSIQSGYTTRLKISPSQSEIAKKLSTLGVRLSRALLIVPFVMSGMGSFPQIAQAQVVNRGNNGCPAGTRRGTTNFITNGNFTTLTGNTPGVYLNPSIPVPPILGFTSDLPYRGDGVYPDDAGGGGLSIQSGNFELGGLIGRPFLGDPINGIPPANNYLYSNPNALVGNPPQLGSAISPGNPTIWQQTVTGLQPNTSYNFIAYFYNLLTDEVFPTAAAPVVFLRIQSPSGTVFESPPTTVSTKQQWIPVQFTFTTEANQTSTTLSIVDTANNVFGDDFGLTAIALNECIPSPEIRKSVRRLRDNDNNGRLNTGDDLQYTIIITNPSTTDDVTNLVIADAIPTQLQVLRDANNQIQFPQGFNDAAPSTSFNGTGNPITLTTPGTLAAGQSITLTYNARIQQGATSPITNQARANFSGDGGQPILSDASDSTNPTQPGSGVNPGVPNADGNINQPNAGATDPTIVNLGDAVATGNGVILLKRITAANRGGVPISSVAFGEVETDTNANAINQAGLRPVGVSEIPATIPLQSGDDVQYTIYFLANQPLNNFNFCDLIPQGTTYIPNTISIVGAGTDADQGRFFSPLTPLAQVPESSICENSTNNNGTVIVRLGNIPSGQTGSVSLRVRIN
jgi:fimbrial isopeptide formation D2 family protein/uncharacterized repeat protein (TIGR01451 family)